MNAIEHALLGETARQIHAGQPIVQLPAASNVYGVTVYEPGPLMPRAVAVEVLKDAGVWPTGGAA